MEQKQKNQNLPDTFRDPLHKYPRTKQAKTSSHDQQKLWPKITKIQKQQNHPPNHITNSALLFDDVHQVDRET